MCNSIYEYDGKKEEKSRHCRHIPYPNHLHPLRRQECGTKLLNQEEITSLFQSRNIHVNLFISLLVTWLKMMDFSIVVNIGEIECLQCPTHTWVISMMDGFGTSLHLLLQKNSWYHHNAIYCVLVPTFYSHTIFSWCYLFNSPKLTS